MGQAESAFSGGSGWRGGGGGGGGRGCVDGMAARVAKIFANASSVVKKFGRFIGPGMMVSTFSNSLLWSCC